MDQHNDYVDFEITATPGHGSVFSTKRFRFRDQVFTTAPDVSGWMMLEVGEAQDPACPQWKASKLSMKFLKAVISDQDRDRFVDLLENARPIVGQVELTELTVKLLTGLADNAPLDMSASSPSGGPGTVVGSGASFS